MTFPELQTTLLHALSTYGIEHQTLILFEEMSELQDAICKYKRGRDTTDHICEEIADVQIILSQMAIAYGEDRVREWMAKKLKRLNERIKEKQNGNTGN